MSSHGKSASAQKLSLRQRMMSRKVQKALVVVTFMFIPLLLLLVFTYIPFAKMIQFSFYDMKYLGSRTFVGIKNYIEVFNNKEIFGLILAINSLLLLVLEP